MRFRAHYLLIALAAAGSAADSTFVLETRSPAPYTPAYLGNGEIGVSTSPLGTIPAECFLSGLYDHAPGDVVRLAVAPAWNEADLFNGRSWLNHAAADARSLRSYRQALDMYDGLLRTEYDWTDGDRVTHVAVRMFVSRAEPDLAVAQFEISPRFDGPLTVRLSLRAWPAPHRYPLEKLEKLEGPAAKDQQLIWYPGRMLAREPRAQAGKGSGLLEMLSQAEGTTTTLAQAVALTWPQEGRAQARRAGGEAGVDVELNARAGRVYTFTKYAAAIPSFRGENLLSAAATRARESAARGYDALFAAHASAWHALWQSDIVAECDPTLQTVIHSMLFHLLGSAQADSDFSVPPMGLSTAGYYGHVFWDADTYMFPPLLLLHPELARPMVMFRYRTLGAARANARRNGYQGAMYPWEAGPDGAETTPKFAFQNALYENHVNGDVALAAWQYYLATGDRGWLAQYGYPILRDTADFWVSRVTYNRSRGRYEIGKVVSVNEALIGVSNDPYTNAVAKKNLELAALAAKVLGKAPGPKWAEVAGKMYLPGSDLLLDDYPLEFPLSAGQRRAIVAPALSKPPSGAMMGVEFEPILGVELHEKSMIDALLPRTWKPYVRPPYNVLAETPTNGNLNFITGAGAFLQQFLYGYSGLRLSEEGLARRYSPLLPGSVRRLVLQDITICGKRRTIAVRDGALE
ncbi:MAG: hypothetical protein LAQ30_09415 [Acidobacteriia bacterium]|nr:hypothetical protein [Terriglobia bacterium]